MELSFGSTSRALARVVLAVAALAAVAALPGIAQARGGGSAVQVSARYADRSPAPQFHITKAGKSGSRATRGPKASPSPKHRANRAPGVRRDAHGRIARDPRARNAFRRLHPCPSTGRTTGACPGYVIDHIQPLKRGGADRPDNMQWQTIREAKLKDRWE